MEYHEVMRKMALQKKMEKKEKRARPRVEEMKQEKGRAFMSILLNLRRGFSSSRL